MALLKSALLGRVALGFVLPLSVSACGGGGGGAIDGGRDRTLVAPIPPSSAEAFQADAEYAANYGLAMIKAGSAYSMGATGAGVRIGVIDTGIDIDHPDLAGAVDPASTDIVTGSPASLDDANGHGTLVAGVVGARRNGAGTHGVAYNASILAVRADNHDLRSADAAFQQADIARGTDYAVDAGARVVNYSLSGDALSESLAEAMRRAAARDVVLVVAAGNGGMADPAQTAASGDPALGKHRIAVGAVDESGTIASFSNRAGTAQNHYLVAPGVGIVTTSNDGGTTAASGTSFATPHVAAAAAVLISAAPHLTGSQVAELLLSTARDLGEPGTDPVYGRGLVDLEAALRPQGAAVVPAGETVSAGGAPLTQTDIRLGAAFGDSLSASAALGESVFLDAYGRSYSLDLRSHVVPIGTSPDIAHWLAPGRAIATHAAEFGSGVAFRLTAEQTDPEDSDQTPRGAVQALLPGGTEMTVSHGLGFQGGIGLGLSSGGLGGGSFEAPFLAMADNGNGTVIAQELTDGWRIAYGVGGEDAGNGQRFAQFGEVSRRWASGLRLGAQIGSLEERGSILGGPANGAFATGGRVASDFGTLFATVPLGDRMSLHGAYTEGLTDAETVEGSIFHDFSTIGSRAFGAAVEFRNSFVPADRLILSVSRPLRVESGQATLDVPVARTASGSVIRRRETVPLAPSGDEVDLGVSYRRPLNGGELRLDAGTRLEPGHADDAGPEHLLGIKLRLPI